MKQWFLDILKLGLGVALGGIILLFCILFLFFLIEFTSILPLSEQYIVSFKIIFLMAIGGILFFVLFLIVSHFILKK